MPTAIVVCNDSTRLRGWEAILRPHFAEVWLTKDTITWGEGTKQGNRPKAVDALFLHEGDQHLTEKLASLKSTAWFVFNEVGTPRMASKGGPTYLSILREAGAVIDLMPTDIQEVADYSLGIREEIPTCCQPLVRDLLLPALAILCEGFLIADACAKIWTAGLEPVVANDLGENALTAMGWDAFRRRADVLERLCELVGGANPGDAAGRLLERARARSYWDPVRHRLSEVVSSPRLWPGGAEGFGDVAKLAEAVANPKDSTIDIPMVAAAYLSLKKRLQRRR